jgi:hypothetical protein
MFLGAAVLLFLVAAWPGAVAPAGVGYTLVLAFFLAGVLSYVDRSIGVSHPKNLAIFLAIAVFAAAIAAHAFWREGRVVAKATLGPSIAPFDVTVREVPVPVTRSRHFIVTLSRGQYPVTSFRYFWTGYTPEKVAIEWTRLETFKVIFDDRYVATCNWSWGREATWTLLVPPGSPAPGDRP